MKLIIDDEALAAIVELEGDGFWHVRPQRYGFGYAGHVLRTRQEAVFYVVRQWDRCIRQCLDQLHNVEDLTRADAEIDSHEEVWRERYLPPGKQILAWRNEIAMQRDALIEQGQTISHLRFQLREARRAASVKAVRMGWKHDPEVVHDEVDSR